MVMNFAFSWLIATQLPIVTTARDVGEFVHVGGVYNITYNVDEDHKVTFGFFVAIRTKDSSPHNPEYRYQGFNYGKYPLLKVGPLTYTVDFGELSVRPWYESIEQQLLQAGAIVLANRYPPTGIQHGDLTTLTYTSGDSLHTTFRNKKVNFVRVGGLLAPGAFFEFAETVAPFFKLKYLLRRDGVVGIQAVCKERRTSQVAFKLSPREKGVQYEHHDLVSAGCGYLGTTPLDDDACLPDRILPP